jgi:hypothetical protein
MRRSTRTFATGISFGMVRLRPQIGGTIGAAQFERNEVVNSAADAFPRFPATRRINQTLERSGHIPDLFGVAHGADVGGGHIEYVAGGERRIGESAGRVGRLAGGSERRNGEG